VTTSSRGRLGSAPGATPVVDVGPLASARDETVVVWRVGAGVRSGVIAFGTVLECGADGVPGSSNRDCADANAPLISNIEPATKIRRAVMGNPFHSLITRRSLGPRVLSTFFRLRCSERLRMNLVLPPRWFLPLTRF